MHPKLPQIALNQTFLDLDPNSQRLVDSLSKHLLQECQLEVRNVPLGPNFSSPPSDCALRCHMQWSRAWRRVTWNRLMHVLLMHRPQFRNPSKSLKDLPRDFSPSFPLRWLTITTTWTARRSGHKMPTSFTTLPELPCVRHTKSLRENTTADNLKNEVTAQENAKTLTFLPWAKMRK